MAKDTVTVNLVGKDGMVIEREVPTADIIDAGAILFEGRCYTYHQQRGKFFTLAVFVETKLLDLDKVDG